MLCHVIQESAAGCDVGVSFTRKNGRFLNLPASTPVFVLSTLLPVFSRNFCVHGINAPIAFFVPLPVLFVTLEGIIHYPIPEMQLSPECRNSINFSDFWESIDEPSLQKFLVFRLSAGDLNDESEEHHRYITELKTIKKYYAEASEMGRNISKWINRFKWESVRPLWESDVSLRL
ncbi:8312_t:CDS:2 [Paraglomus brasilianum]|uniref:8312_t:CDS:1 n=1 Tax=Paraglomus brasilianum TaxID=144538 RepID=A0A9N8YTK5_9GLOM|nr:8312_t:CDS:2 [Paraglomus brasilianum]